MTTHYSLSSFIRQAANRHLAEYAEHNAIDLGTDISQLKPRTFQPIFEAVMALPEDARAAIDADFRKVALLGNQAGLQHLRAEADHKGLDLGSALQTQNSFLNKAFWAFLNHRNVFDRASRFATPHLTGRYWKRGLPLVSAPGIELGDRVDVLREAISLHFFKEEGRGRACKVDYDARRPSHMFYAFPEDYPAAPLAWLRDELAPHPFRPAFEVVFVYRDDDGTLDVYFEGAKASVDQLWQLFARSVLGLTDLPTLTKPAYWLEPLKSSSFSFTWPIQAPITSVRTKRLTFATMGDTPTRVSVTSDVSNDGSALHRAIDRLFVRDGPSVGRMSLNHARVVGAQLQAVVDHHDGTRPKTRSFDISEQSCALKHDGDDLHLRHMLAASGIDRTTGFSSDDAPAGSRTQRAAE